MFKQRGHSATWKTSSQNGTISTTLTQRHGRLWEILPDRRDDVANLVLGHEWVGAPIETTVHNVVGTGKLAADAIGVVSERGLARA